MWRHFPTVPGGRPPLPLERPRALPPVPEASPSPLPSPLLVPDLVGQPSTEARRLARAAHLAVTVDERHAREPHWGLVLAQDPPPGSLGPPDGIVSITVGARPHVTVPDVRGREADEALTMLREAGLGAARRVARRSDQVPEGCVLRTRPRAGAEVPAGSRISYIVAAGPRDTARAGRKHGRHAARVARLADGSFLTLPDAARARR